MDAFCQVRTWKRAWRLGVTQLLCLGRRCHRGVPAGAQVAAEEVRAVDDTKPPELSDSLSSAVLYGSAA